MNEIWRHMSGEGWRCQAEASRWWAAQDPLPALTRRRRQASRRALPRLLHTGGGLFEVLKTI